MKTAAEYRAIVASHTEEIQTYMNKILLGEGLDDIEPVLKRIDPTGALPSWFEDLKTVKGLNVADGKTIGSVLEKLLVCVIEKHIINEDGADYYHQLSINPARGVDIPEIELGIKSPSENFCTSEPYFSAYERLLGNEYDALVVLTDFQSSKKLKPLKLQLKGVRYLRGTEISDRNLCETARYMREILNGQDVELKKVVRFLAYINQSDWEANKILKLIKDVLIGKGELSNSLLQITKDFDSKNSKYKKENKPLISIDCLNRIKQVATISPLQVGIVKLADDWVITEQKDNGRFPNDNEWRRFLSSPLDGKITMSFALQWRYNFSHVFEESVAEDEDVDNQLTLFE